MGSFRPLILCLSGPNKLAQTAQLHLGSTQNLHMNKPFKGPQRGKQVLYIMLSFSLGSYIYIYHGSYSGEWPWRINMNRVVRCRGIQTVELVQRYYIYIYSIGINATKVRTDGDSRLKKANLHYRPKAHKTNPPPPHYNVLLLLSEKRVRSSYLTTVCTVELHQRRHLRRHVLNIVYVLSPLNIKLWPFIQLWPSLRFLSKPEQIIREEQHKELLVELSLWLIRGSWGRFFILLIVYVLSPLYIKLWPFIQLWPFLRFLSKLEQIIREEQHKELLVELKSRARRGSLLSLALSLLSLASSLLRLLLLTCLLKAVMLPFTA